MTSEEVVEVLTETARRAGHQAVAYNGCTHPEDIAYAMSSAVECGGIVLTVLRDRERK